MTGVQTCALPICLHQNRAVSQILHFNTGKGRTLSGVDKFPFNNQISIPVLSAQADDGHWVADDLANGMPDNAIIDESIRLYEEEVDVTLR